MRLTHLIVSLCIVALPACQPDGTALDTNGAQAEALPRTPKSVMNGTSVDATATSDVSAFWLNAWQVEANGTSSVTLSYNASWSDPESWLCTSETYTWCEEGSDPLVCHDEVWDNCRYTRGGWRYLWADGLDGAVLSSLGTTVAALNVTLDGASGGWESCTYDEFAEATCSTGAPTGSLALSFSQNGQASGKDSGKYATRRGKYEFRESGSWEFATADVSGTLLGEEVTAKGSIRVGRNVTKERGTLQ